jgi:hypothetical protein
MPTYNELTPTAVSHANMVTGDRRTMETMVRIGMIPVVLAEVTVANIYKKVQENLSDRGLILMYGEP